MASRTTRLCLALLSLGAPALLTAAPAAAQSGPALPSRDLHAGTLEVPLNKSQVVNADRPIAKAMIGNDDIADILPLTDRSIYVLGKKMGTTSLTLYDAANRVNAEGIQCVVVTEGLLEVADREEAGHTGNQTDDQRAFDAQCAEHEETQRHKTHVGDR